jgi:hypothetical protein
MPIVLSVAVFQGWTRSLVIVGLYLVTEIVLSNFVEPMLYGANTRCQNQVSALLPYQVQGIQLEAVSAGALKQIIIWPAANRQNAHQFAQDCLRFFHSGAVKISRSNIPHRPT